ncbi:hypothetical protein RKD18_002018 [Streptomyces phaeoluteigriseus]
MRETLVAASALALSRGLAARGSGPGSFPADDTHQGSVLPVTSGWPPPTPGVRTFGRCGPRGATGCFHAAC